MALLVFLSPLDHGDATPPDKSSFGRLTLTEFLQPVWGVYIQRVRGAKEIRDDAVDIIS